MKNQLTRKVGFEGTPKLGPYWKSQPVTYKVKYGVGIRIESVNKDNSHSWVRISHGLNKLVTDLSNKEDNDNEQELLRFSSKNFALKTNVLAFASRSKAKEKPRIGTSACSSTRTIPIGERSWTDNKPEIYLPVAYPVSKTTEYSSSSW